jgi:hypothetical protein
LPSSLAHSDSTKIIYVLLLVISVVLPGELLIPLQVNLADARPHIEGFGFDSALANNFRSQLLLVQDTRVGDAVERHTNLCGLFSLFYLALELTDFYADLVIEVLF